MSVVALPEYAALKVFIGTIGMCPKKKLTPGPKKSQQCLNCFIELFRFCPEVFSEFVRICPSVAMGS